MGALRDGVEQGEKHVLLLRELRVFPEAVLVVVLEAKHHVVLTGDGKNFVDALDDPLEALVAAHLGIALAGEHPADRAGTAQSPRNGDQLGFPIHGELARRGRGW